MAKSAAKKRRPVRAISGSKTKRSLKASAGVGRGIPLASKPVKRVTSKARPVKPAKRAKALKRPVAKAAQRTARPVVRAKGTKASVISKVSAKSKPAPISSKHKSLNGSATHRPTSRTATPVTDVMLRPMKPSASKASPVRSVPVLVPDSRVATNLKPRKNQAGLGVKELENFRGMLLEKRREILGDMSSMESEALGSASGGLSTLPVHLADMGTDNYEQEFTLGLVEKDRLLLREINHALAKIQNGAYGICEGTGGPIGKPRLEVQPWARYGIEFARQRERNGMGIR